MNDMFRPEAAKPDARSRSDNPEDIPGDIPPNVPPPETKSGQSAAFDWNADDDAIVCQEQPMTAVYENGRHQVVIRQERSWDREEDPLLVFNKNTVPDLIRSLARELGDNCFHAINDSLLGMDL